LSDRLDDVFAALSDPTRRGVVQTLLRDGTTSVPSLAATLPISRQAIAKHVAALDQAGLIERAPLAGREVRYRLRPGALRPAAEWVAAAEGAWDARLARLKETVEEPRRGRKGRR
jgi:DNA-binding transcriptional ArsR family regulator